MMKSRKVLTVLAVISLLGFSQLTTAAKGPGGKTGGQSQNIASLSYEETATLSFMREEEKLARDVYRTLFDVWENPVFSNISSSEQTHMNALEGRLNFYQVPDPVVDDYTGAFTNTDLAGLYLTLTENGQVSLLDALMVGALIEELDMRDLQHAIDESTHADLDSVYEELMRGSRNHLRAFVGQIEHLGIVYEAQEMDQEAVDAILDGPLERG